MTGSGPLHWPEPVDRAPSLALVSWFGARHSHAMAVECLPAIALGRDRLATTFRMLAQTRRGGRPLPIPVQNVSSFFQPSPLSFLPMLPVVLLSTPL